eukprot:TRINITY_DN49242_c0_g1_i1.p1 TRINITY_DN49242_c0_g1~~TRINITY_DN49242_c0_g1_i1.p1  ORF type:complete len:192 (-),score=32.51 TRINITY_DN49242_c0_g1_i1:285-860(-)
MSVCRVVDVKDLLPDVVLEEKLSFEVTIDLAEPLQEDVLFRCCFIVDPKRPDLDVELDSIDVGNGPGLPQGTMKFALESPSPTRQMIESSGGVFEVAGLYISALYREKEFCRVGYFLRHEYVDPKLHENPPENVDWSQAIKRVLSEPCVTRFAIPWDPLQGTRAEEANDSIPAEGLTMDGFEPLDKRLRLE